MTEGQPAFVSRFFLKAVGLVAFKAAASVFPRVTLQG